MSRPLAAELRAAGVEGVELVASLTQTQQHYTQLIEALKPQGRLGVIDDMQGLDAMPLKGKALSLHWEMMFTRSLHATEDMAEQQRFISGQDQEKRRVHQRFDTELALLRKLWESQRLPAAANQAILLGLTVVVSIFAAAGGTKGARTKLTAALLLTAYVWFGFKLFQDHHLVLPLVAPRGAAFTTSFAAIIWQLILEEKQKGRIKGMFGAYVSPQLVERMVDSGENPQLGGHDLGFVAAGSGYHRRACHLDADGPRCLPLAASRLAGYAGHARHL